MEALRGVIKSFSVSEKQHSVRRRRIGEMAGYEAIPTVEAPLRRRTREAGHGEIGSTASRRRSGAAPPSKNDVEMRGHSVVEHQIWEEREEALPAQSVVEHLRSMRIVEHEERGKTLAAQSVVEHLRSMRVVQRKEHEVPNTPSIVEGPPHRRTHQLNHGKTGPTTSSRRPITSPSMPRKIDSKRTVEKVIVHQKSIRHGKHEGRVEALLEERRLLQEQLAQMNKKNDGKMARLGSLKEKDDAEKWEDDVFEKRMKELRDASTVIQTQSTITGKDIREQIKDLNLEIARVAAAATEIEIKRPTDEQDNWERISLYLGYDTAVLLQSFRDHLNDKRFIQAILQMFLSHVTMRLLNSWCLEKPSLDDLLNRLYNRIRGEEERITAGKWRQITVEQMPHGPEMEVLSRYIDVITRQLMELSSHVGRGGDTHKIKQLVRELMNGAERIRMNIRAGIISADLQPWIADCGERYDATHMKDVSEEFGLEGVNRLERCIVLGSIELGLRVHPYQSEDDTYIRGRLRTKVLLLESLHELVSLLGADQEC